MEVLIESRALQDQAHCLPRPGEHENAALVFEALHCPDQNGQPGTVNIRNAGKIHHQSFRLLIDYRAK